jgi:thiamine biosynthesis lipoprotein
MNRRHFLDVRRLAHTAGQVAGAIEEARSAAGSLLADVPAQQEIALVRVSRRAMATTFEVVLPCGFSEPIPAAEDALDVIENLESQLTVYRDDSEISRLNRRAGDQPVAVEERLYDLLRFSARLSEQTNGAFDVTAGALTKAWGFFRREGRVPTPAERKTALGRVGYRNLLFDDRRRTIRFLHDGLEINLGSIGKGYALDRAGELLQQEWGITAGLLHGGHSSVLAIGSDPRDEHGWAVAISHPWDADRDLAVVRLRNAALATSAATFQHLQHKGRSLGHVLDPRTAWPAEEMASATVIAPTAATADALSTAFFVMGVAAARAYCAAHPEVGAVLLPTGENQQPIRLNLLACSQKLP